MPLDPQAVLSHCFDPVEQPLTDVFCILYALSLGVGSDPMCEDELPCVFVQGLRTFPTLPVVLGHPGTWSKAPAMGITHAMIVHGKQRLELVQPFSATATVIARHRNTEVTDKGGGQGRGGGHRAPGVQQGRRQIAGQDGERHVLPCGRGLRRQCRTFARIRTIAGSAAGSHRRDADHWQPGALLQAQW